MVAYATSLFPNKSLKLFLVGSSMGGAIALLVAQRLQEQVTGVVLLAPMLKLNVSWVEHCALKACPGKWKAFQVPRLPRKNNIEMPKNVKSANRTHSQ